MYFICDTVHAMDTCAVQQPTWHPAKRDCPLGPPFICTFAMSFIEYIFHEALMSYCMDRLATHQLLPIGALTIMDTVNDKQIFPSYCRNTSYHVNFGQNQKWQRT